MWNAGNCLIVKFLGHLVGASGVLMKGCDAQSVDEECLKDKTKNEVY
jgi:hypothetical protein